MTVAAMPAELWPSLAIVSMRPHPAAVVPPGTRGTVLRGERRLLHGGWTIHRTTVVLAIGLLLVTWPAVALGEPDTTHASQIPGSASPTDPSLIVGEVEWTEDRTVEESIVVTSGSTLTIRAATIDFQVDETCTPFRINGMYCQPALQVEAGGMLLVEDAVLTTNSEDPHEWPFVSVFGGEAIVEDSKLSNVQGLVTMWDTAHLEFRNNTVEHMLGEIGVWRGATGILADNVVRDSHNAFAAQDASPTIERNMVRNATVFGIRVQQSIVGDKTYMTNPTIQDNVIRDSGTAIFSDTGAGLEILHNRFANNTHVDVSLRIPTQDFMVQREPVGVEKNVFNQSHKALRVSTMPTDRPSSAKTVEMHMNDVEAWCTNIEANSASGANLTVDAGGNYWRSLEDPRGSDCQAFTGTAEILTEPELGAPPSNAGPRS